MELNKRQNELSIQQEQNSARWIKEQEETQNLKPVKMFNETNAVRLAAKTSQDKILLDFFFGSGAFHFNRRESKVIQRKLQIRDSEIRKKVPYLTLN